MAKSSDLGQMNWAGRRSDDLHDISASDGHICPPSSALVILRPRSDRAGRTGRAGRRLAAGGCLLAAQMMEGAGRSSDLGQMNWPGAGLFI